MGGSPALEVAQYGLDGVGSEGGGEGSEVGGVTEMKWSGEVVEQVMGKGGGGDGEERRERGRIFPQYYCCSESH